MKYNLLFVFSLLCATILVGQDDPYMTKDLSGETIRSIESKTSGGSISVVNTSQSDARIEVYVKGNNGKKQLSQSEIEDRLKQYDLTVDVVNNELKAIAKRKQAFSNNWKNGLSISFSVFVPGDVDTKLATSGGSIALKGLQGTQDFATSGGSLSLNDVKGDIDGKTSGGSISAVNCHEDLDLATSGGSISANNCTGNMELATSGGSLSLVDLDGDVEAATSGGSISGNNISGALDAVTSGGSVSLTNIKGTVKAGTSGGTMNVEINELGESIDLSNSSGNITLELPMDKGLDLDINADKIVIDNMQNFSGSQRETSIDGTVNGGGVPVRVKTGSGKVTIRSN